MVGGDGALGVAVELDEVAAAAVASWVGVSTGCGVSGVVEVGVTSSGWVLLVGAGG